MRIMSDTEHKALSTTQAYGKQLINKYSFVITVPTSALVRGLVTPDSGAFRLAQRGSFE